MDTPPPAPRPLSSHALVALQFCGIALACYPPGWQNHGPAWALALCLAGAALGVLTLCYNTLGNFSVYPEIRAGARLITGGPYRYVRHPMYSAVLLMMAGVALFNGTWLNLAGLAMTAAAVTAKAAREERLLLAAFPGYAAYRAATGRFLPWPG